MVRRTNPITFRNRTQSLIRRDGIQAVAAFYGRSPQTIRRWAAGTQVPRSRSVQRSVADRGRNPDNHALTIRDAQGRIVVRDFDDRTTRAINTQNRENQRLVSRGEEQAQSDAERQMIREQYSPLNDDEMNRIAELMEQREAAIARNERDSEWWANWRDELEAAGYTSQ